MVLSWSADVFTLVMGSITARAIFDVPTAKGSVGRQGRTGNMEIRQSRHPRATSRTTYLGYFPSIKSALTAK
jgi:hypothetical protein